jgi:uncharacterized membrane protein (DUF373 family)
MPNLAALVRRFKDLPLYERFEQIVSRAVMLLISIVVIYSLALVSIDLFNHFVLGPEFMQTEMLKDIFGSILTILILIEFNHSIWLAITRKSGALQARVVVLIAILVIARKVILLDFSAATSETLIGISGVAVAFGLLYWLLSLRPNDPSAGSPLRNERTLKDE